MTGFFALLRLQLLSRFADMKPRNLKAQLKEKKGRIVGKTLLTVFLVLYLGGMLFFIENKMLDVLIRAGMPDLLITMAVVLATVGTLLMSFFFVFSSLYLGRDAAYLAALPLKPRTVLSAKLTQVWISETCIDAFLILPACILYAVRTGTDAGFYLRLLPVWLLVSVLPICIIAFLSSFLIRASSLWKHREAIMIGGGILLFAAYMFLMMNLGSLSGDSASGGNQIAALVLNNQNRIRLLTRIFPPAGWAVDGLLGRNPGMLILWIGVSLAAAAMTVWLLGFNYRELSLLQTETPDTGRKRTGKESFGTASQMKACCQRELKSILRTPSYATNILPIAFMPLLMVIMMMFVTGNMTEKDGETIQMLFSRVSPVIVMGILAAVLSYMAGMNPALSTAVSREGKGHDFLTALPVSAKTIVRAKLIVGFGLALVGVLAASAALAVKFPAYMTEIVMAFILCLLFAFANSVLALNRDIRKPRLDWVTEQEAVKQNFGVLISMLISWAILAALGVLTYFLAAWGLGLVPVFAILAGILALLCALVWIRLNKVTEKYYCAG